MDSLTTNTPAPTVSTEATQPVQQAQPDKSARFKEKAENQASKVMAEIEKLQKLSNKKYYTYSTEQINELFGAIQSALDETKVTFTTTNGMFILFRTGLRIGEFCGLTLKDIDLERRTINVNHQLQYVGNRGKYIEKTKTEAGTRVLPMSDEVYAAFKRVVQNRKKPKVEEMIDGYTGFLFLDKRGKPMMPYQWEKRFQHVVEKYNRIYRVQLPKITPHVCRHTFCTNAAKRGISVETLKYLMGHTDISVTSNVYTHLKLEDAQREMERLERIEKEMKKCAK